MTFSQARVFNLFDGQSSWTIICRAAPAGLAGFSKARFDDDCSTSVRHPCKDGLEARKGPLNNANAC
jgi:hypothetical protein